jgi:ubiquinone/menaquinone biosynthesis C-methylase UbiE
MAEDSGQRIVSRIASELLPLVPGLEDALRKGIAVLDAGCGTGGLLIELAQRHRRSSFTGVDLSVEAIEEARRRAAELRLVNLRFESCDATDPATPARFDLATAFGVIHRVPEPTHALSMIAATLRPGGILLMQEEASAGSPLRDAERPLATFSYALSCLHSVPTTRTAGSVAEGAMWGAREARRALAEAGFHHIEEHALAGDPRSAYFVARASGRRLNLR